MAQHWHRDMILRDIRDVGYWTSDDAATGELADNLTRTYEFKTEKGIDLIEMTLAPPIRGAIEDFFKKLITKPDESISDREGNERKQTSRPTLGFYKCYGETERAVSMMPMGGNLLIVVAWAKASRMTLYARSQHLGFNSEWVETGLFKRKDESSEIPGATLISMPQGGVALVDGRLWWKVEKRKVIMLGYMTPEELESNWNPMEFPRPLLDRLKKLDNENLGMNFTEEN